MSPVFISLLSGMLLGQRHKVTVLAPAILLVLAICLVAGAAHGDMIWVLIGAGSVMSLQLGYLAGAFIRQLTDASRPARLRASTPAGSPTGPHPPV